MRKAKRTGGRKAGKGARRTGLPKSGSRKPAKVRTAARKPHAGTVQKKIQELQGKVKDLEAKLRKALAEAAELRKAMAISRPPEPEAPLAQPIPSGPTVEPSKTGTL